MIETATEQKQYGLMERLQQAWAIAVGKAEPEKPQPQGLVDANYVASLLGKWQEIFAIDNSRQSRYADFALMDKSYLGKILDHIVMSATTFEGNSGATDDPLSENRCFKVEIGGYATSGPAQVLRQVLVDTKFRSKYPRWARDAAKWGDKFIEPIFDGSTLVDLVGYPTSQIIVHRDGKGRLASGVDENGHPLAYQQINNAGTVVAGWYPHEMIHVRYSPSDEATYSACSFLDAYRQTFKRVEWLEQAMVIARIVRAYMRLVHEVDMTGKSTQEAKKQMEAYIRSFTTKVTPNGIVSDAVPNPEQDYFVTKWHKTQQDGKMVESLGAIKALDPNGAAFAVTNDVDHFVNQYFDLVPAEDLGLGKGVNPELDGQDIAFAHFIRNFQYTLEDQLIRRVFDIALIAKGYRNVRYSIVHPQTLGSQSWKLADAQFRLALSMKTHLESGTSDPVFWMKRLFGLSEEQAKAEVEKGQTYLAAHPVDKGTDTSLAVAGNQSASKDVYATAVEAIVQEVVQ
jgi:hypothetical protein